MVPRCRPLASHTQMPPGPVTKMFPLVHFHSIAHPIVFSPRFLPEDTAVAQTVIRQDDIDANIAVFAVIDVKMLAVRRERKAIGLGEIFREQFQLTGLIEPVDTLKWEFGFPPATKSNVGSSEVQSSIRTDHDIIWNIKFLTLVVVGQDFVSTLRGHFDDGAQFARAIN
jgi:hypothetical protein